MKAKYFKKLRIELHPFLISTTESLFGFPFSAYSSRVVLARNHRDAVVRGIKRGIISVDTICDETSERWGKYKIRRSDHPENHRFIKYFD